MDKFVERPNPVDLWTVAHGIVGFWSGIVRVPTNYWAMIAVGFEVVEHLVLPRLEPPWYEVFSNSFIDIVAGIAGNVIGHEIVEIALKKT